MIDDDRLERALTALPLEEPPPGLRARILAATIYHPAPAVAAWEIWVFGTLLAVLTWSLWALVAGSFALPNIADAARTAALVLDGSVFSPTGIAIAAGISATLWIAIFWRSTGGSRAVSIGGR